MNQDKQSNNNNKDEASEDSSEGSLLSSEEETSWISWFCSLRGNEFFVEVDEEYIQDDFNLTGLSNMVQNYDYALDMILDVDPEEPFTDEQQEAVTSAAEMLYGLIHARFILTSRGLGHMLEKYNAVDFGRCPRVFCQGQPVIPVGQSDIPRTNTVKLFCPRCQDIYYPKYSRHCNTDGAYFGTSFPHLFLGSYPEIVPQKPAGVYVPRIYGFKIHKSSPIFIQNNNNNNTNNNSANLPSTPAVNNAQNSGTSTNNKQLTSSTNSPNTPQISTRGKK